MLEVLHILECDTGVHYMLENDSMILAYEIYWCMALEVHAGK